MNLKKLQKELAFVRIEIDSYYSVLEFGEEEMSPFRFSDEENHDLESLVWECQDLIDALENYKRILKMHDDEANH